MSDKFGNRGLRWAISLMLALAIAAGGGVVLFGNVLRATGPTEQETETEVAQVEEGGTTTVDVGLSVAEPEPEKEPEKEKEPEPEPEKEKAPEPEPKPEPKPEPEPEPAPEPEPQPAPEPEPEPAPAPEEKPQVTEQPKAEEPSAQAPAEQPEQQAAPAEPATETPAAQGTEPSGTESSSEQKEESATQTEEPAAEETTKPRSSRKLSIGFPSSSSITVSVSPTSKSLAVGATQQLTATKSKAAATLTWSSSDETVATVSASGLVTAKKAGTAKITVTATYSDKTASATSTITVTSGSYPVFCYALIPGAQADGGGSANASWFAIGVGTVSDVPDPSTVRGQRVASYTLDLSKVVYATPMFPDITYQGKTYAYSASGEGENTYSLIPMRLVSAAGANSGYNNYFRFGSSAIPTTYSSSSTACYHLDYTCVFNEATYRSVTFAVKEPGDETFIPVESLATRVKTGTSESSVKPSASAMSATKTQSVSTKSGSKTLTYAFDGWYKDEACTQKATFGGTVEANTVYYGRYVQQTSLYNVRFFYDGAEDVSKSSVQGPVNVGSTVQVSSLSKIISGGKKTGYTYSNAVTSTDSDGGSLVVSEDWANSYISLYYVKSTRPYRVSYVLNGTTTTVAPADQLVGELNDTVVASPKQIAGYTPVSTNPVSLKIADKGNEIVFSYYRNVTLTAGSAEPIVYDGAAHDASFTVEGALAGHEPDFSGISIKGHKHAATHALSFPEGTVGTVDGTNTYIVADCTDGSMVIEPAPLRVTTPDASKVYDGKPLTSAGAIDGLVAGETASFATTGSQTEVGSSRNEYTLTWDGTAKESDYRLVESVGTLTVREYSGEIVVRTTTGGSFTYDGQPHGATAEVVGLPEGYSATASSSVSVTDVTDQPVVATVDELTITNAAGEDVTDRLNVRRAEGTITIKPAVLHVVTEGAEKTYDGTALTAPGTIEGFVADETATFEVTGSQTAVGSSRNRYAISWDGTAKQTNYVIDEKVGTLCVTEFAGAITATVTGGGSFVYDGQPHGLTVEVTGLPEGYVVAKAESHAQATHVSDGVIAAHVDEISILNAAGEDVTSQLNIAQVDGSISITPAPLSIVTQSASKIYDGEPLVGEGSIEGLVGEETVSFAVTGKRTRIGSSKNTYTLSWDGTARESDYALSTSLGTLTVTESTSEVVVTTTGGTFAYDGQAHGATVAVSALPEGYEVETAACSATATDVTDTDVVAHADQLVIRNKQGDDVTANLKVRHVDGTIRVTPAPLVVTMPDASKGYDGTPLTAEGTVGGLVEGETVAFKSTGSQTEVGSSANTYSLAFAGEQGAGKKTTAKRGNYRIEESVGTLRVNEYDGQIQVRVTGGTFAYDGTAHGATVEVSELPEGYRVETAASSAQATDVTEEPLVATADQLKIVNAAGTDVTARLKISEEKGQISVTSATLVVTTESAQKVYDGEPLTAPGTIEGLVEGETATFAVTGSQQTTGSSANGYELTWDGTAKQANYRVEERLGTLKVDEYAQLIRVVTTGGEFTYDGQPHGATVEVSDLPAGYTVAEAASSTIATDATSEPLVATADTLVIRNTEGTDVTGRLNIERVDGTIVVHPAPLTVTTGTATKVYDGSALTADGSLEGLVADETATLVLTGSQTQVGSSDNSYRITWDGTAKRGNYLLSEVLGTLTVTESADEVVVTTTGGTFTYDGQAHGATVEVSGLPEGYTLGEASSSASATDVTAKPLVATADTLVIRNAAGEDVTKRLNLTYVDGIINITPAPLVVTTPSASRAYDGTALAAEGSVAGLLEGETATFETTGSQTSVGSSENGYRITWDGTAKQGNYRIEESLGTLEVVEYAEPIAVTTTAGSFTYDGQPHGATVAVADLPAGYTLEVAESSVTATDVTTEPLVAIVDTLVIRNAEGEDVTSRLNIVQNPCTLEVTPAILRVTTPDASKTYDGEPLTAEGSVTGWVAGESASFATTGTRTSVGSATNTYRITWDGTAKQGNYQVVDSLGTLSVGEYAGEISVAAVGGIFTYDGQPHGATVKVGALPKGYRLAEAASSATATNVSDGAVTATADTLSIVNARGDDVTARLNISRSDGTISIVPAQLTVVTESATKAYDGSALRAPGSVSGLVAGETVTFEVTGGRKRVGSSPNSYTLTWDGTAAETNYVVSETVGTLTVTESGDEVVVTTTGGSFTYDGRAHRASVEVSELPAGYTLEAAASSASVTDVTEKPVAATADTLVIRNGEGEDVTAKLKVVRVDGTLAVTPAPLTVRTPNASKTYDGTALTATGTLSGLVPGETVAFKTTGSQTEVGSSDNGYTLAFAGEDGAGEATTARRANYAISEQLGTLEVSEYDGSVTVAALGGSFVYDGSAHRARVTVSPLPRGYRLVEAASDAVATDVTAEPVAAEVDRLSIVNAAGTDVTDRLDVVRSAGTITITPAPLAVTTPSASKTYDGTALTAPGTLSGLVAGETAAFSTTGTLTDVGTAENAYTLAFAGEEGAGTATAKRANYTLDEQVGTLEVSEYAGQIDVRVHAEDFVYDGTEHHATVTVSELPAGYTVERAASSASVTNAAEGTVTAEADDIIIRNAAGVDVTDRLNIVRESAPIKIVPRAATVTVIGNTNAEPITYDGTEHVVGGYVLQTDSDSYSLANVIYSGEATARGTDAGTYAMGLTAAGFHNTDSNYDITFAVTDGGLVIGKAASDQLTGHVDAPGWQYGATEIPEVEASMTGANDYGEPTIEYRVVGSDETTTERPVDAGDYEVIVTWPATDNCPETVVTKMFTISRAQAHVVVPSATKVYDGTPLEASATIELVGDDTATVRATETVTNVTAQPVANGYEIDWGETKETNYDVTAEVGTLLVTPAPVSVTTPSATKVYDGKPLTSDEGAAVSGLVEGETVELTVVGSQTEVGSSANECLITWASGGEGPTALQENYEVVSREIGTLTVTESADEVVVTTTGGTFTYDGQAHGATVTVSELPEGYTLDQAACSATATDVTKKPVKATADTLVILNAEGKDVTKRLNVVFADGSISIVPAQLTVSTPTVSRAYDGTPLTAEGTIAGLVEGETVTFETTGTQTDAGETPNSYQISWDGTAKQDNYALTENVGTLTVDPKQIVVRAHDQQREYATPDPELTASIEGLVSDEDTIEYKLTRTKGSLPATYAITASGEEAQGNYLVSYVPATFVITDNVSNAITLTAPDARKTYDGLPLVARTRVAATGLPEGFTVEATTTGTLTDAGSTQNQVSGYVISTPKGRDVTAYFKTVSTVPGTLTVDPRHVTLTSADASKEYDGSPLIAREVSVGGDGWAAGEGATYQVSGSQTIAGSSANPFIYRLADGTKSGNYRIEVAYGTLQVSSRSVRYEIDLVPASLSELYDGSEHAVEGFEALEFDIDGNKYTVEGVTAGARMTSAGTKRVSVTGEARVLDAEGNDVTGEFFVKEGSGTLTVRKRALAFSSASAEKAYDGTPLTNGDVTVGGDGFAEGEGATFEVTGSQTLVGTSANVFTYAFNEGTYASNYDVSVPDTYGTLSVYDRSVKFGLTLTANSGEFMYDGDEHEVSGLKSTVFTLDGVTYAVEGLSATETATDAGDYAVNVVGEPHVYDVDHNDVTSQFKIDTVPGTLSIRPREVTLTSATTSKPYDGTVLTDDRIEVTGDGWAPGEGASYEVRGAVLLPSSVSNAFSYTLDEGTKEGNYVITTIPGILSVTNRDAAYQIELHATSDEVRYDGEEHAIEGFETLEFDIDGNHYTVEGVSASAAGTEPGDYPTQLTGAARVLDAEGNDVTDQFAVTIVGGLLKIRSTYTLEVSYVSEQGETVADSYVGRYEPGEAFGPIASPVVKGMLPSVRSVQSDHNGMPEHDVAVRVTYGPASAGDSDGDGTGTGTAPVGVGGSGGARESGSGTGAGGNGGAGDNGGASDGSGAASGIATSTAITELETMGALPPMAVVSVSDDGEATLVSLEDERVPLAESVNVPHWAILNLLAVLVNVVLSALLVWQDRRRRGDADRAEQLSDERRDEFDAERRKLRRWWIGTLALSVASAIVFLLTEDLSAVAHPTDGWTPLMVLMTLLVALTAYLSVTHQRRAQRILDGTEDEAAQPQA